MSAMSERERGTWWGKKSRSAKVFTVLAFTMMLGVGLCGTGAFVDTRATTVSEWCFGLGVWCFWGALLVLVIYTVVLFFVGLPERRGRH